jgi:hypothetical protein
MAELTKEELLTPVPAPKDAGLNKFFSFQQPYLEKEGAIGQRVVKAEGDILRGKQAQDELLAGGESTAQKQFAETQRGAMQQYGEKLEKEPLPSFIPTKDNAQDLAGLFSLISVIGMIAGKQDAQRAMGAMNGMLEGYQKGRGDLYKKESIEFEKNFKSMLKKHEEFRKEMEDAIKLASTDKEAGVAAAKLAAVKAGSNVINAQIDKGQFVNAAENVSKTRQAAVKANEMFQKEKLSDKTIAAANERARLAREQAVTLAKIKAGGKAEKAPNDVEKAVRQNATFLDNISDIVKEADTLIKQGKIRGIGVIQGKIPYDIAQTYMTTEERNFLQNFNALTNQKLKDQSGATVTGQEFARQRGVLPLRDDQPNVVLDKLKNWNRLIAQETAVIGKAYPSVIRKYGIALPLPSDKSKLVPGLEYDTPEGKLLWDGEDFLAPEDSED